MPIFEKPPLDTRRFGTEAEVEDKTVRELRGMEGRRVKTLYEKLGARYGVTWKGRNYDPSKWDLADGINRAVSAANAALYALTTAVVCSLGYLPQLGFVHTDNMLAFIYDMADLYKPETTLEAAFEALSVDPEADESAVVSLLKATFCCFHGVSEAAERRLWQQGIESWDALLRWPRPVFSARKWRDLKEQIMEAKTAYDAGAADYFLNRLPGIHRSRVLYDFAAQVGYVDIETDGLARTARITTVALRGQGEASVFVARRDMERFIAAVAHCRILVTYNGAAFDLPRLRRRFRLDLAHPHIDLMPLLRQMGCSGGQKRAEELLGLRRECRCADGKQAVDLWQQYEDGNDEAALETLIEYNTEDVHMLERLLTEVYRHSMATYPGRMLPAAIAAPCSLTTE